MPRLLVAAIAALVLAGCALLRGQEPAAAPAPPPAQVTAPQAELVQEIEEVMALLAYYQRMLGMSAEDLRREHQLATQALARDKTEFGRLRLALLLNVPSAAFRDDAKLTTLLETSAARNGPPESPRRQFVTLLHKLVSERMREQRRADELQLRADELQQKLDAVLEIERSLRNRRQKKP